MRLDALQRLHRVRSAATDQAKLTLAECLAEESTAERGLARATTRLADEAAVALADSSPDGCIEAYFAWLPEGRRLVQDATATRDHAMISVGIARAALAVALAEEHAITHSVERQIEIGKVEAARRETVELDEMSRRPGQERV